MEYIRIHPCVQKYFSYSFYVEPKTLCQKIALWQRGYRDAKHYSIIWRDRNMWSHPKYYVGLKEDQ